jgi:hypothetical protein
VTQRKNDNNENEKTTEGKHNKNTGERTGERERVCEKVWICTETQKD